jgi:hypothetical protein
MKLIASSALFVFLSVFSNEMKSQETTARSITVRGSVYDIADSTAKPCPMVINKRSGTGLLGSSGANFTITGLSTDTFLIAAGGYEAVRYCFRDSAVKEVYALRIGLKMRENQLKPVTIYPIKDLDQIKKERAGIGQENTNTTQGVTDAVSSPLTYLYERFSQEGKSKAAVAAMENEDHKREILKSLLRTYVRSGVVDLKEEEFDAFIDYLNIPEAYLRTANDYDLALMIRQRYLQYKSAQEIHRKNQR